MGTTGSRSSPPTETLLLRIQEYSKLMRAPGRDHRRDLICFRELRWDTTVTSRRFGEETGVPEEYLVVGLFIGFHCSPLESALDISIEILDQTGLYTVFQRESGRDETSLVLSVRRNELEASSCVRPDDSFYVRFTVKEKRRPGLLGYWFPPKPEVLGEFDMGRGHELTVDSLSETKAALLSSEFVHSTRFDVGGSRSYIRLCPGLAAVRLVRATKEDDETRTTAEFGFALQGAVNVRSERMTHTFDRDSPHCEFKYQPTPPEEEQSTTSTTTDRVVVMCCVQVLIPPAVPSSAATIPATTVQTLTGSVLTPLLRAMQD